MCKINRINHLEFIRQHFLQFAFPEHMETLLKHLLPVCDVGTDRFEWHTQVQPSLLNITGRCMQLLV